MPKLPTREDLGGLPSARTGRATARYQVAVPDLSAPFEAESRAAQRRAQGEQSIARATGEGQQMIAKARGEQLEAIARMRGQGEVATARAQGLIGQGIQDFGAGLNDVALALKQYREQQDELSVLKAKAKRDIAYMEFESKLDDDPDYTTLPDRATTFAKETDATFVASIPPHLHEKATIELEVDAARFNTKVAGKVAQREREQAQVDLVEGMQGRAQQFFAAKDPAVKAKVVQDNTADLDKALRIGLISPAQHVAYKEQYVTNLAIKEAEATLPLDPDGVARTLNGATDFEAWVVGAESTNNPAKVNTLGYAGRYQFGATRLADLGVYTLGAGERWTKTGGQNKWTGTFHIPGHENVTDLRSFLADPAAQKTVFDLHVKKMDEEIATYGFGQFIGQTINDVKITPEGLYAMLHLGGVGSTRNALHGKGDASDAYGTSVMSYAERAGKYARFGSIDNVQRADLTTAVLKAQTERMKVGSSYEANLYLKNNPGPLNPLDEDVNKRIGVIAEERGWSGSIMGQDPEKLQSEILPFIKERGIIPKEVVGAVDGLLRSSNPKAITFALETMDDLQTANPRAFDRAQGTDTQLTQYLAEYRTWGKFQNPDEFATEIIERRTNPDKEAAHKAKLSEGETKAKKVAEYLSGYFYEGPLSGFDSVTGQEVLPNFAQIALGPETPLDASEWDEAKAAFIPIYAAAFERYGSHDKAMPVAMAVFKRTWTVSNATGTERIMRYAPEMFNPKGTDPSWIRYQTIARLHPLVGDRPFIIQADQRTELEIQQGKMPTWSVSVAGPWPTGSGPGPTKTAVEEGYKIAKMKASAGGE